MLVKVRWKGVWHSHEPEQLTPNTHVWRWSCVVMAHGNLNRQCSTKRVLHRPAPSTHLWESLTVLLLIGVNLVTDQ